MYIVDNLRTSDSLDLTCIKQTSPPLLSTNAQMEMQVAGKMNMDIVLRSCRASTVQTTPYKHCKLNCISPSDRHAAAATSLASAFEHVGSDLQAPQTTSMH